MFARKAKRDLTVEEQLARGPLDVPFLMLALLLTGIGLVAVFSASYASAYYESGSTSSYSYFIKQGINAGLGLIAMILISHINYQTYRIISVGVLAVSVILLILVIPFGFGKESVGAQRWIYIGPFNLQPSEIAKLGVILFFSARLSKRDTEKKAKWSKRTAMGRFLLFLDKIGFIELLPYGGVLLVILFLLYLEPHMSGMILILLVGAMLLFVGGIRLYWFFVGGGLAAGVLGLIILNTSYQHGRVATWLNPWADPLNDGFQIIQSLLAIGSGGLAGLGLGNSRQKFLYLPEEHNDFIFSIWCEEMGFIGAAIVVALFALLIMRGYWIAIHARDRFGALIVVGIVTLLAAQVILNICVVTNSLPTTGISLPFFSYGGTALMIQLAEVGIVLGVSRQAPAYRAG
ncbi:MAG: cell division protein FtsW [Oscillospiraceae bacterium]|nr:cell division protein FtsW [Oscillospiraceae bacterium]